MSGGVFLYGSIPKQKNSHHLVMTVNEDVIYVFIPYITAILYHMLVISIRGYTICYNERIRLGQEAYGALAISDIIDI